MYKHLTKKKINVINSTINDVNNFKTFDKSVILKKCNENYRKKKCNNCPKYTKINYFTFACL